MDSINISTNWLSSKPINSCVFVKFGTNYDIKGSQIVDSESNEDIEDIEDIETLLENYENCIKLNEPTHELNEETIESKIFIKTCNDFSEEFTTIIDSFSILCSAKVIEIHGNETNEYLKTLFNELVEELDGLSMFRSDYKFIEPQKEITITFKSFTELWIYGLVVKLNKIETKPVINSKEVSNFSSIFNMISMFSNSSKDNSSADLIRNLSQLKSSEENEIKEVLNKGQTKSTDSRQSVNRNQLSDEKQCQCLCHQNSVSNQEFNQYLDQKFSDLEKSIENKFNSLENKMFSVLNLFINKQ